MNRISGQITSELNNPHKRDLSSGSYHSSSSQPLPEYLSSSKNIRSVDNYSRLPRNSATRVNASVSFNPGLLANPSSLSVLTSTSKSSNNAYLVSGFKHSNQSAYSKTHDAGWNPSYSQTTQNLTDSSKLNSSSQRSNYSPIVIHSGTSSQAKLGSTGPLSTYTPLVPTHSFTQSQRWNAPQLQNPSPIRPYPQVVSGIQRPQTTNSSALQDSYNSTLQPNQSPSTPLTYSLHAASSQPTDLQLKTLGVPDSKSANVSEVQDVKQHTSILGQISESTAAQKINVQQSVSTSVQQVTDWESVCRQLQNQLSERDRHIAQQKQEIDALKVENAQLKLRASAVLLPGPKTDPNYTQRSSHGSSQESDPHKFLELFAQLNDEKKRLDTLTAKIMHAAPAGIEASVTRMSGEFSKNSFVVHTPAPESEGLSHQMSLPAQETENFTFKKKTSVADLKQSSSSNFALLESDKIAWYRQMKKQKESVLEPSTGQSPAEPGKGRPQSQQLKAAAESRVETAQAKPTETAAASKPKRTGTKKSSKQQKEEKAIEIPAPLPAQTTEGLDGRSPHSSRRESVSESGESTLTKILAQYRGPLRP